MKKILLLLPLCFFTTGLWAVEYDFYGDLSLKGFYSRFNNGTLYDDGSGDFADGDLFNSQLTLNGIHRLSLEKGDFFIHHETGFDSHVTSGSRSELKPVFFNHIYEARANLYPGDSIQLRIGKQKVNWGLSYFFDPTDLINPFEPESEQMSGFYGLNIVFTPSDFFSMMTILSFDKSIDTISGGQQLSWSGFFEGLTGGINASFLTGSLETRISMIFRYNEVYRPGLAFSLDALGMIFTAEGAVEMFNGMLSYPSGGGVYIQDNQWEPRYFAEFSMERDFLLGDWTLSALGEYYFNGSGYTVSETSLFYSDLNNGNLSPEYLAAMTVYSSAETYLLGRHYGMFSLSLENPHYLSISSAMIINFQDGSFLFSNSVKLLLFPDIDIYADFSIISGVKNYSEFGLSPENYMLETGISYHF